MRGEPLAAHGSNSRRCVYLPTSGGDSLYNLIATRHWGRWTAIIRNAVPYEIDIYAKNCHHLAYHAKHCDLGDNSQHGVVDLTLNWWDHEIGNCTFLARLLASSLTSRSRSCFTNAELELLD
jgi:hypothetical protein